MYTIQRLTPNDFQLAKELFLFFQIDDAVENPTLPSDAYLRSLLNKTDFYVLVALQAGKIAAGLTAYELPMYKQEVREMFLFEIATLPEYRQQGIASQLINYLIDLCKLAGIEIMFVATEKENDPAQRLYTSTGGKAEEVVIFTYS